MAIQSNRDGEVGERLKVLGYAHPNRIRMYGEEFDLTSNPIPEENGFAVEAISRKSGLARRQRIPLSIVQMITKDLAASTLPSACLVAGTFRLPTALLTQNPGFCDTHPAASKRSIITCQCVACV